MTTATVNKEFRRLGIPVKMYKGKGYYYFMSDLYTIESIYSFSLYGWTLEEIVQHVRRQIECG